MHVFFSESCYTPKALMCADAPGCYKHTSISTRKQKHHKKSRDCRSSTQPKSNNSASCNPGARLCKPRCCDGPRRAAALAPVLPEPRTAEDDDCHSRSQMMGSGLSNVGGTRMFQGSKPVNRAGRGGDGGTEQPRWHTAPGRSGRCPRAFPWPLPASPRLHQQQARCGPGELACILQHFFAEVTQ